MGNTSQSASGNRNTVCPSTAASDSILIVFIFILFFIQLARDTVVSPGWRGYMDPRFRSALCKGVAIFLILVLLFLLFEPSRIGWYLLVLVDLIFLAPLIVTLTTPNTYTSITAIMQQITNFRYEWIFLWWAALLFIPFLALVSAGAFGYHLAQQITGDGTSGAVFAMSLLITAVAIVMLWTQTDFNQACTLIIPQAPFGGVSYPSSPSSSSSASPHGYEEPCDDPQNGYSAYPSTVPIVPGVSSRSVVGGVSGGGGTGGGITRSILGTSSAASSSSSSSTTTSTTTTSTLAKSRQGAPQHTPPPTTQRGLAYPHGYPVGRGTTPQSYPAGQQYRVPYPYSSYPQQQSQQQQQPPPFAQYRHTPTAALHKSPFVATSSVPRR